MLPNGKVTWAELAAGDDGPFETAFANDRFGVAIQPAAVKNNSPRPVQCALKISGNAVRANVFDEMKRSLVLQHALDFVQDFCRIIDATQDQRTNDMVDHAVGDRNRFGADGKDSQADIMLPGPFAKFRVHEPVRFDGQHSCAGRVVHKVDAGPGSDLQNQPGNRPKQSRFEFRIPFVGPGIETAKQPSGHPLGKRRDWVLTDAGANCWHVFLKG